jgi:membrane-associated phospholipid phosphatase
MMRQGRLGLAAARWGIVLGIIFAVSPAQAASGAHDVADFLSGTGNLIFLGAGIAEPFLLDHQNGKRHSLRVLDAALTATLAAEALKLITHEQRPDHGDFKSFPSGHATAAFAVASNLTEYYPGQAPYWYLGAAAIGWSRVELRRHRTTDVVAGAALGYWLGKVEARSRHGLVLGPVLGATGTGLGLNWRQRW